MSMQKSHFAIFVGNRVECLYDLGEIPCPRYIYHLHLALTPVETEVHHLGTWQTCIKRIQTTTQYERLARGFPRTELTV